MDSDMIRSVGNHLVAGIIALIVIAAVVGAGLGMIAGSLAVHFLTQPPAVEETK